MDIFVDKHSGVSFCMKIGNPCAEYILANGIYEYPLIQWCKQFLSEDSTFVDIGAHMGTYSILLHSLCKEVHAFEAQKDTYDCLCIGTCINNAFNIKTHPVALGSKEDTLTLYQVSEDGGCSSVRPEISTQMGLSVMKTESVSVKTLDSFNLKGVDFLKIDVEGYELEVLKGASMTLFDNNFPPFIFEAWPDAWYKEDREALLAFVRNLGYTVHPISGTNNMYLASDHPLRPKTESTSKVESVHNLKELCASYEQDAEKEDRPILNFTWDQWHALAKHYRLASKHAFAYDCAKKGLEANPPADSIWMLYEEISIVAYYLNRKEEGFTACEEVILSSTPWSVHNQTLSNIGYYMQMLPIKKKIPLIFDLPTKYSPSTASIISHNDGYRLNLRGVNYILTEKGEYISRHGDGIIRTINHLLEMDSEFNLIRSVELTDHSGVPMHPKNVLGMEDIRLFHDNYFFCTNLEVNPNRVPQICWGTYQDDGSITRLVPLMAGTELKCEKNWMPFLQDGTIYFIYAMGPFQLYKLDVETGKVEEVKKISLSSRYIDDFRGSASPIPYQDGWLCTIHQVHHNDPRKYYHRFVWLNRDFTAIHYSLPFFFEQVDVEFNLSLCHSPDGLIMTYSVHDANSMIAIVDYDVVDAWVHHYQN